VIVDAHHHFWDPATADYPWLTDDLAPIRRAFGPADLEPDLLAAGVDATVLVQTRSSIEETVDFLGVAGETPFVREADIDVVLLAGRYTILEQGALDELLPACLERGVGVFAAGVMNSGVLANPGAGSRFNYTPAPPAIVERARRIGEVCARHDVPLRAAAVQFAMAHPAMTALVTGVRTPAHLEEYPSFAERTIPADLWADLRAEGLIRPDAPTPA
jgi:aryl-alcohol dehydrogenase-like predicted oxidoreductase